MNNDLTPLGSERRGDGSRRLRQPCCDTEVAKARSSPFWLDRELGIMLDCPKGIGSFHMFLLQG
jgi:hypothetical protein